MEVPVDEGKAFADANPLMAVFRQLLFARIVPNLDKLGLRTPKVRELYGSAQPPAVRAPKGLGLRGARGGGVAGAGQVERCQIHPGGPRPS